MLALREKTRGRKGVTWLCCKFRLWELKPWPQPEPCFPLELDTWSLGPGPLSGPAGWGGEPHALHAHVAEQPSAIHPTLCRLIYHLESLAQIDSEFILFLSEAWVTQYIWYSVAQLGDPRAFCISFLMREKAHPCCPHLQSFQVTGFRDRVSCHLVYNEKIKPRHISLTDHGRAQVVGGRSPVFQGVLSALSFGVLRCSIWTSWA